MAMQDNSQYPTFDFAAKNWENPAAGAPNGVNGGGGTSGIPGRSHWDGGQTRNICDASPTPGQQGGPGQTPSPPPKAQQGRSTARIQMSLGVTKGPITINYGAGNGQNGGTGGNGGSGGPGGPAGACPSGCSPATDGAVGNGANGGGGGAGGDAGQTSPVYIYYYDAGATFTITLLGCQGGTGGVGGQPGGGSGNPGPGPRGANGNPTTAPPLTPIPT